MKNKFNSSILQFFNSSIHQFINSSIHQKALLFFATVFIHHSMHGQLPVIQIFQGYTILNTEQANDFVRISQFAQYSEAALVKVNPLTNGINAAGNLQIGLSESETDECQNLEYIPKASRFINDDNYYYYGALVQGDTSLPLCQDGEIMLMADEGKKFGYFTVDETRYEIVSIDATYSVLAKINPDFFSGKIECDQSGNNSQYVQANPENNTNYSSAVPCLIKVLFLYTNAAAARFKPQGLYQMAIGGIGQANQAFSNSLISNVRVEKTAVLPFPAFVETPQNIVNDIVSLVANTDVAALRNAYSADVVCMITDGDYGDFLGYSGIAPVPGGGFIVNMGNPVKELAFMIVQGHSFNAVSTFCHELGHTMGCRHQRTEVDPFNSDDGGTIEHGFSWVEGHWPNRKYRTSLVHAKAEGYKRLLYYSNPDVEHNGKATGTSSAENNASWIRSPNGCIVANYYEDPIPAPLVARIEGEEFLCKPDVGYYNALPSIPGTYTYEWHKSTNGINWGQPIGTGQSVDINSAGYQIGQTIFLRVMLDNLQGVQVFAFFEITILGPDDANCPRSADYDLAGTEAVQISPNPTIGDLSIKFILEESQEDASIQLYSATGVKVFGFNRLMEKGFHEIPISTHDITSGPMLVRVKIGNIIHNQFIIKL